MMTPATKPTTMPQGWPPEQPTVEVGTLLRLAKAGVVGIGLCLVMLTGALCILVLDRRDAAEARQRIIEILAHERK